MNAFLEKHKIDVGNISSVLLWSATADRVMAMLIALVVQNTISLRVDALFMVILAIAMWQKKNWARITLVVVLGLTTAFALVGMVVAPSLPLERLTVFGQPYSHALFLRMCILIVLCLPISVVCILALVAPKTRLEFQSKQGPNQPPEPVAG
jgi:hypothetical protein